MHREFKIFILGFLMGMTAWFVVSLIIVNSTYIIKQKVIDAGVGEYYLDEDSKKQFRFITQEGLQDE